MKLKKRILVWLIVGYVLSIIGLSLATINTKLGLNNILGMRIRLDYLFHVLLFVPWMVLVHWCQKEKKGGDFFLLAFGIGLLLAVISETVQIMVPSRTFNINDLLFNGLGVFLGALISGWGSSKSEISS